MSEEENTNEELSSAPMGQESDITSEENELELLKQRADLMGLNYHHKAGVDKIRKLIADHLSGETEKKEAIATAIKKVDTEESIQHALLTRKARKRNNDIRDATRLVRVIIHSNDPKKQDWQGEYFTVSNALIGSSKRFVPYNNDAGWHIPKILFDTLKEKEVQLFRTAKNSRGDKYRQGYSAKAYNIIELPPLTERQLKELAASQAARNSIDN